MGSHQESPDYVYIPCLEDVDREILASFPQFSTAVSVFLPN